MPIYAYRCSACGHAKDVLQKLSEPVLTVCPSCGQASFVKQVTAAGFQLKGSGWYVTDFRDGNKGGNKAGSKDDTQGADGDGSAAKPADAGSDKPAAAAAAPASAPAAAASPSPAAAPAPAPAPSSS